MAVRTAIAYLSTALSWRSPAHGDILERERGQALLRVSVTTVATFSFYIYAYLTNIAPLVMSTWMLGIAYVVIAAVFFWYLLHTRTSPAWRRYATNLSDMAVLSLTMISAGESGMPAFLFYLWVTLGNGFRFGVPPLIVSAVLSVIGFSAVVALTEVWRNNPALAVGVFLSLVVLPFQAARYILQHQRNWASVSKQDSKTNHTHRAKKTNG